jgi:hypothetical protein
VGAVRMMDAANPIGTPRLRINVVIGHLLLGDGQRLLGLFAGPRGVRDGSGFTRVWIRACCQSAAAAPSQEKETSPSSRQIIADKLAHVFDQSHVPALNRRL